MRLRGFGGFVGRSRKRRTRSGLIRDGELRFANKKEVFRDIVVRASAF